MANSTIPINMYKETDKSFEHIFVSILNFPVAWNPGKNNDVNWLAPRIEYFFKYTYPSFRNQKDKQFKVFLVLHTDTPLLLMKELAVRCNDIVDVTLIKAKNREDARSQIKKKLDPTKRFTIQTHYDSDDILNINLTNWIKQNVTLKHNTGINFDNRLHYIAEEKKFYIRKDMNFTLPIVTIVEDKAVANSISIISMEHDEFGRNDMYDIETLSIVSPYALVIHNLNSDNTYKRLNKMIDEKEIVKFKDDKVIKNLVWEQ